MAIGFSPARSPQISNTAIEAAVADFLTKNPPVVVGSATDEQVAAAVSAHFANNPMPQLMAGDSSPAVAPMTSNDIYFDADSGDVYTGGM